MAMWLVFGAMAEQRHGLILRQVLEEAQGEFLAVILDSLITAIDQSVFPQFLTVAITEFGPGNFPRQKLVPELLARAEISHPNIEAVV